MCTLSENPDHDTKPNAHTTKAHITWELSTDEAKMTLPYFFAHLTNTLVDNGMLNLQILALKILVLLLNCCSDK